MIARTYVCKKCESEFITEPMTYAPECDSCGEYMEEDCDD